MGLNGAVAEAARHLVLSGVNISILSKEGASLDETFFYSSEEENVRLR